MTVGLKTQVSLLVIFTVAVAVLAWTSHTVVDLTTCLLIWPLFWYLLGLAVSLPEKKTGVQRGAVAFKVGARGLDRLALPKTRFHTVCFLFSGSWEVAAFAPLSLRLKYIGAMASS